MTRHKWWDHIETQRTGPHQAAQEELKSAIEWYCNEGAAFLKETAKYNWDGLTVQANLYQRDIDILRATLYAGLPKISIRSTLRDPEMSAAAEAFQALLNKVWVETRFRRDVDYVVAQALFGNVGYMRLEFDPHRQIPVMRWVDGQVIYDQHAKGDPRRGLWCAEVFNLSFIDVYNNEAFPADRREALREQLQGRTKEGEQFDMETQVEVAYVWSKKGAEPWRQLEGRKLIVLCKDLDEPLLIEDWAWPFIDLDRFPVYRLMFNKIPGSDYGVTMYNKLRASIHHYNWAASFSMEDAKKSATGKIFYDRTRISDPSKIFNGKHKEGVECTGNPNEVMAKVDLGSGSTVALSTFQLAKQIHDEQSGINDVARGDSLGERTTAEEVRTRSRSSSTVFKLYTDAIDDFLDEVVSDHMAALIYFVPQWDRVVLENTIVQTVFNGQMWEQYPIELDEAAGLASPMGLPDFYVMRPGVNSWIGVNHALAWKDYDIEQLKRDFAFSVQVGSTHADYAIEKQRNVLAAYQTLSPLYMQIGAGEQVYELAKAFVESMMPDDPGRFIPPRELFTNMQSFVSQPGAPGAGQDKATPAEQPPEQTLGMQPGRPMGAPSAEGLTNEPAESTGTDPGAMA